MNKTRTKKSILIGISVLGLVCSIYAYYQLLTIVPAFADMFAAFDTSLSAATQFIIHMHPYFLLLSSIGLAALLFTLFDKITPAITYLLVVSNLLVMFAVRWLIADQLNQTVLTMGVIQ